MVVRYRLDMIEAVPSPPLTSQPPAAPLSHVARQRVEMSGASVTSARAAGARGSRGRALPLPAVPLPLSHSRSPLQCDATIATHLN